MEIKQLEKKFDNKFNTMHFYDGCKNIEAKIN